MWTYFPSSIVKMLIVVLCLTVAAIYAQLYILTIPEAERAAAEDVRADIAELRRVYEDDGLAALKERLALRIDVSGETGALYALADLSEEVVAGNLRAWPRDVDLKGAWRARKDVAVVGDETRIGAGYSAVALEGGYLLFVGRDLSQRRQLAGLLKRALLFSLATAVVSAAVAGFALAAIFNRRMQAIADAAEDIIRGDLSRRVAVGPADDEFTALAQSINMMLERIEHLMGSTRMLTDSIAHHVRGTVTRFATQLRHIEEVSSDPHVKELTGRPLEEANELLRLLDGIIEIARADAGLSRAQMKPVALDALVRDLAEIYEPLAADHGIALETGIASGVSVVAHQALVAQALCNLIENSIKYAAAGQKIELCAGQGPAGPFVSVSDSGPGITPEQRARAIARFSRLDRKSGSEGVGLGLSIVAAIARLHGAALSLEDNAPGLRAVLLFPTWPKRRPSWALRTLRF